MPTVGDDLFFSGLARAPQLHLDLLAAKSASGAESASAMVNQDDTRAELAVPIVKSLRRVRPAIFINPLAQTIPKAHNRVNQPRHPGHNKHIIPTLEAQCCRPVVLLNAHGIE